MSIDISSTPDIRESQDTTHPLQEVVDAANTLLEQEQVVAADIRNIHDQIRNCVDVENADFWMRQQESRLPEDAAIVGDEEVTHLALSTQSLLESDLDLQR